MCSSVGFIFWEWIRPMTNKEFHRLLISPPLLFSVTPFSTPTRSRWLCCPTSLHAVATLELRRSHRTFCIDFSCHLCPSLSHRCSIFSYQGMLVACLLFPRMMLHLFAFDIFYSVCPPPVHFVCPRWTAKHLPSS